MMTTTMVKAERILAALAAVVALGAGSASATAQQTDRNADAGQCRGAPWTALGIGRISCTACELSYGRNVEPSARFGTEPVIAPMSPSVARGDRIREGDRLVAVEGELITTSEGVAALLGVREGQEVTLTVRRDGATERLRIVAGDACAVEPPPLPARAPEIPGAPRAEGPLPAPSAMSPLEPPEAPMPAAAPAAPGELLPHARLGFGFSCSKCGIRDGRWFFSSPPEVTGVEGDGPAWEAGFRTGDEIVGIEGHAIESEEGERAFSAIEPGDRVRWDVRRDGRVRRLVLTAIEKPARPGPAATPRSPGHRTPPDVLRYHGVLGDTDVEVRGAPVSVTVVEEAGEIVIRTSDTIVRLKRVGTGG